jgi:hypothetical protein
MDLSTLLCFLWYDPPVRHRGWTGFAGFLLIAPAAWAANSTGVNATSESSFVIDTLNTAHVTDQVNTFQTELKARMQGGAYLFDQTYSAALSSPTVQAAITQAKTVLTSHGAVSFTGPTLLSSNQSTTTTNSTVQNGTTDGTPTIIVHTFIGPITITVGYFGTCTGYTDSGPQGRPVPTGCTGGTATPLSVVPGGQDTDTLVIQPETINQTVTTTNTTLTSQVYEIDGSTTPPPATPAPPSLILMLAGLGAAGLFAARHRLRRVL